MGSVGAEHEAEAPMDRKPREAVSNTEAEVGAKGAAIAQPSLTPALLQSHGQDHEGGRR